MKEARTGRGMKAEIQSTLGVLGTNNLTYRFDQPVLDGRAFCFWPRERGFHGPRDEGHEKG